jgi:hypothetical protein
MNSPLVVPVAPDPPLFPQELRSAGATQFIFDADQCPPSERGHLIGGLFLIEVTMDQNSDLSRELVEVGIAIFVIAILFSSSMGVGLFFHYI